jgi:iron(III) transport system substrate-binding protein
VNGPRRAWWALGALLGVAAVACAPAPAPPAAPASGASAPGSSAGGGGAAWEAEWARTLAAAKREGRVVIAGPPGDQYRGALSAFQQSYPEIQIDYAGSSGRDFTAKIIAEQQAGQYLWDVHVGGADSAVTQLAPAGVLDPLRSALIRPERWDDAKWINGFDWGFMDAAREHVNAFSAFFTFSIYINRDVVPESEFSRVDDLLSPRFRGKIVVNEPREAGSGSGNSARLLKSMGRDWLRRVFHEQDLVVTRNLRQQIEWLVRGQYPIAIGIDTAGLDEFQRQGLGRNVRPLDVPEGRGVAVGFGGCACAVTRPPHPNAAKVYLDWLLSYEGQTTWAKTLGRNSRRADVEVVDRDSAITPGVDHFIMQRAENHPLRDETIGIAKEALP